MPDFKLVADFQPTGDQPHAIDRLADGLAKGLRHQTLLGATGTGKTFTIAKAIERHQKPTLVLAHNKTLAAQLYAEFREFFPDNAVEYFVSYFDYYQPEAYLPRSDTYIEKDSSRNDEIDKLRHAATHALFERRDVIIVASVSCIYGLGAPVDYGATVLRLRRGGQYRRDAVLRHLVDLQYQRNDQALQRARFRVRGDTLEIGPASDDRIVRVEFFGDEVERITEVDPLTGELLAERNDLNVYPATHFVTPGDKLKEALVDIEAEMELRVGEMEAQGRILEAARLRQRTTFDLEMMRELGYCSGVENYSRHLARRAAGSRPWTLLDYFPPDWLLVVDESHMSIPQVVGMYKNDRTRKEILVDFGFRLPSALDNRPLTFEEFETTVRQAVYLSATPGPYELEKSERVVEQLIRPTGVVDPGISVRPDRGPDRRPPRGDPQARRARRAVDRDDADQEDGRGPRRLPARARGQGPVPPLRGRHPRAGADPARPPAGGPRRPRRDQPPARGDRPARGDPRRDPRRRQGGVPAERLVADPDDRASCAEHRRRGRHVRGPGDRVDAGGDRRDEPPARGPAGLQRRPRDRADDDHQGDPRHQRAPAGGRRDERDLRRRRRCRPVRPARSRRPERRPDRGARDPHGGRHARRGQEPRVRACRDAARRGPADPAAGARGGRLGRRREGRRAGAVETAPPHEGPRVRARRRRGAPASAPPSRRRRRSR